MKASREASVPPDMETIPNRWDTNSYAELQIVRFDENSQMLTVSFADGDQVTLDPSLLVPSNLIDIDWWRVAANRYEIVVPHSSGWFEIPWDVIRVNTDPEFDAHLTKMDREIARDLGQRIRILRERKRYSVDDAARRSGLSAALIVSVETGDHAPGFDVAPILAAMGHDRRDLNALSIDEEQKDTAILQAS